MIWCDIYVTGCFKAANLTGDSADVSDFTARRFYIKAKYLYDTCTTALDLTWTLQLRGNALHTVLSGQKVVYILRKIISV